MTGFSILCKHELYAVWRTWHRYVLPTVLCLFGAMSVVLSRFAPDIVGSIMGEAVRKAMPEPNWHEAYNQWTKNLAQTVMFVVIFTGAGATSSLVSSGRAQLLAVRPVSRASQPLAALVARIAVLASASLAGMAVVWAATLGFYRKAPPRPSRGGDRNLVRLRMLLSRRDSRHVVSDRLDPRSRRNRSGLLAPDNDRFSIRAHRGEFACRSPDPAFVVCRRKGCGGRGDRRSLRYEPCAHDCRRRFRGEVFRKTGALTRLEL